MDTDRIKGAAQELGGKLQQGFGSVTGDRSTQAEGAAREIGGKAQGLFGEAKDQVRDVAEDAGDYARQAVRQGSRYVREGAKAVEHSVEAYPVVYLLAAAAAGFFASMLFSDHLDRRYLRR